MFFLRLSKTSWDAQELWDEKLSRLRSDWRF